jgi:hypothetical protein
MDNGAVGLSHDGDGNRVAKLVSGVNQVINSACDLLPEVSTNRSWVLS